MTSDNENHRAQLEADANRLRANLFHTLESLEERRHEFVEAKHELVEATQELAHSPMVSVLLGAGAAGVLVGGAALVVHQQRKRTQNQMKQRLKAVQTIWQHPEALTHPRDSLSKQIAFGVAVNVATLVVGLVAKRTLLKLFPKLRSDTPAPEAVAAQQPFSGR